MRQIKKGATSQSLYFVVLDSASSTGGRKTGLAYNTSSLTAYYVRNGGSATAITLATLAAANSSFSSGGFKEIDATNMPGIYRLDVPDAAIASGADSVVISIKGASGMVQVDLEIQLVAIDLQNSVRAGLTALPNAAAEAAGGLYTRGTGAGQINQPANGQIDANAVKLGGTAQTGRDIGASVLLSAGTGTGQLDFTSGVVKANLAQILGTALTETAGQIAAAFKKWFDVATPTGTVNSIPNATAGAAGGLFIAGSNAATTANITGNITGNVSGSVGSVTGAVGSVTGAVGSVTGAVGSVTGNVGGNVVGSVASVTAAVTVGTNNDKTGYRLSATGVDDVWDEATSGHATAGTTGAALTAAGSAGDPWATVLPGAYSAGTAGYIVGNNLDAAISSRLASGSYVSPLDAAATRAALGLASANLDTQFAAVPSANANADALLGRNIAGGSSSGRLVKEAFYLLRNKRAKSGSTLSVYGTDDSTVSWTASLTTATSDPIASVDPA